MSRAWVIFKRIGRLLKFLLVCVVLTVCILLLWRVFSTGIPKELKALDANVKLKEAYSAAADGGKELYVFDQIYDNINKAGKTAGYFGVPEVKFIPDANQAQIVFRYNNSTVRGLAKDYSLDPVPQRDSELFDVSLTLYIDTTPNDKEDNYDKDSTNYKKIRVLPTKMSQYYGTTLYNFYRYTFDFENAEEPIDLKALMANGTLIAIHAEMYYTDDIDYSENPYGALCIYDGRRENNTYKLSKDELKALGGK